MKRKEHNRFNLSCIIYSISLVLILFVVVPELQKWLANQVTAAWQEGYDAGLAARPIPTIKEIQKQIGAKVDGIWGSETNELYDKALCNQFAAECFEGEPK